MSPIQPKQLAVPYGAEFTYRPGSGVNAGNVYSDPWQLALILASVSVPCKVYVDCSFVSPAPWPVNFFLPGVAYAAAPVFAPTILGLMTGTDPFGNPSEGALWFPSELDGVGIVNVDIADPSAIMVNVGQIFGQRFTMKNGAFIQRANDLDLLALFITANPTFDFTIENCPNPFPNLGNPASTGNVLFFGAGGVPGRVLNLLMTLGGPNFVCNSFTAQPAGSVINVEYDGTIPEPQTTQTVWATTGTVNQVPFEQSQWRPVTPPDGSTYNANPNDWVRFPNNTAGATVINLPDATLHAPRVRVSKGGIGSVQVFTTGGQSIYCVVAGPTTNFFVGDSLSYTLESDGTSWWRVS